MVPVRASALGSPGQCLRHQGSSVGGPAGSSHSAGGARVPGHTFFLRHFLALHWPLAATAYFGLKSLADRGCLSLHTPLLHSSVGPGHQLALGVLFLSPKQHCCLAHPEKAPLSSSSSQSSRAAAPSFPSSASAPQAARSSALEAFTPRPPCPHIPCAPQYVTPLCSPACEQPLRLGFIFLTCWPLHSHQVKLQPNKKENRGRERKKERPQEAPSRSNQVTVSIPIRTDAKHIIKNRSADPSMLIIVLRFRPQPTPLINKETAREGGGERVAGIPLTGASCSESSREKLDT